MKRFVTFLKNHKIALGLGGLILLLLLNNIHERQYWTQIERSFSSIYQDRLVVESYIFKISDQLHQQKHILQDVASGRASEGWEADLSVLEDSVDDLLFHYEKTHLTPKEHDLFFSLEDEIYHLRELKTQLIAKNGLECVTGKSPLFSQLDHCFQLLSGLSEIQIGVGKDLNDHSHAVIQSSSISSTFEIAILILIGLVVEMFLFASKSLFPKFPQKPNLN